MSRVTCTSGPESMGPSVFTAHARIVELTCYLAASSLTSSYSRRVGNPAPQAKGSRGENLLQHVIHSRLGSTTQDLLNRLLGRLVGRIEPKSHFGNRSNEGVELFDGDATLSVGALPGGEAPRPFSPPHAPTPWPED